MVSYWVEGFEVRGKERWLEGWWWWLRFSVSLWRVQRWQVDEVVAFNLSGAPRSWKNKERQSKTRRTERYQTTLSVVVHRETRRKGMCTKSRPTIIFTRHFFLTSTFTPTITLSPPHLVFVGINNNCQLIISRQNLHQSGVVIHGVTGQAEQTGP